MYKYVPGSQTNEESQIKRTVIKYSTVSDYSNSRHVFKAEVHVLRN